MSLPPLLPIRHKQGDFFIADIFDNLPFKNDTASMEHPVFSLSTKPDLRTLTYESSTKAERIEVIPSSLGLPTIFDKDILLYCASHVMERVNKGEIPPKTIRLSIHDLLISTNRETNGKGYKLIKKSLNRLRGCTVNTTIKTGDVEQLKGFGLIDSFEFIKSHHVKDRLVGLEITLSEWFYESLVNKQVLTIDKAYFRLRKSLDRRLYEIARKHCHQKILWKISLDKLHLKSGSTSLLRRFRHSIRELEKTNHLPQYLIKFDREKDMVSFRYRGKTKASKEEQLDIFGNAQPDIPTQIPPDLLDDVRHAVGTGLDYYDLWQQYINWDGSKNAKNIRGGFIGFCKRKAAKAMRA